MASLLSKIQERKALDRVKVSPQIRAEIKVFCKGMFQGGCEGELRSSRLHSELKAWAALILKLANGPENAPVPFQDIVALNNFSDMLDRIEKSGQSRGLSEPTVNEYKTKIQPLIDQCLQGSMEMEALKSLQRLVQNYWSDIQRIMDVLVTTGPNIGVVVKTVTNIRNYIKAVERLADDSFIGQYTPRLDKLMEEISDPKSPLHYSPKVFDDAYKHLSNFARCFSEQPCGALVDKAFEMDQRIQAIAEIISLCHHDKQAIRA